MVSPSFHDSDYTLLATRIREAGYFCHGHWQKNHPQGFLSMAAMFLFILKISVAVKGKEEESSRQRKNGRGAKTPRL
jgi:hypothetical protein